MADAGASSRVTLRGKFASELAGDVWARASGSGSTFAVETDEPGREARLACGALSAVPADGRLLGEGLRQGPGDGPCPLCEVHHATRCATGATGEQCDNEKDSDPGASSGLDLDALCVGMGRGRRGYQSHADAARLSWSR
jgi:hypothetical protein